MVTATDRHLVVSLAVAVAIHVALLAVGAGDAIRDLVRERSIPIDVSFEAPTEPVVVEDAEEPEEAAASRPERPHSPAASADIVRDDVTPPDDPDEGAVLDFFDAEESSFALRGGVSAGNTTDGTGAGAARPATPVQATASAPIEASRAAPVSLPATEWDCPWPDEADDLGIHRQVVTLRAVVDAEGRPQRVTVLSDPGYGFGEAARACAERVRFTPARDDRGEPYAATSPPIRVRFNR